jgi:TolB-like protein
LEWLANNESSLSAIAAIIAIVAGIAVGSRLVWTRMPGEVKRPAFLSDWRNIALICLVVFGLLLLGILTIGSSGSMTDSENPSYISGKPSVAVLPLNNISGDPEQTYLADGIAEDVITLLSRNPRIFVIARNSSFTYRGQAVDIRQVGEELGVRYVVEGSLRKIGDRLRVTVQLIDTGNGQHIWAQQYDRAFADIFALQDDITNGITFALGDEIYKAEIARAESIPTENLDAWGLVMKSNRDITHFNRRSAMDAVPLLRAAIALDPDYTLARATLTRSLCYAALNLFSDDPAKNIAEAYALGEQAVREAPDDPLVLFAVGSCYGFTGRSEEAIRLLGKALDKQPYTAQVLAALGISLTLDGRPDLGLPKLEAALQYSPQSPHRYMHEMYRAASLNGLGRYREAEQAANNGLKSYDGWYWTWVHLAIARAGQKDYDGAKEALHNAKKTEPRFSRKLLEESMAIIWQKNGGDQGRQLFSLLEPTWPENLLTADE